MASFEEAYAALDEYRAVLSNALMDDSPTVASPFASRGAFATIASPLGNVHATGVGVRLRGGKLVPGDFVLKVFVFDKQELGSATPSITGSNFQGVGIDVEPLPVQRALDVAGRAVPAKAGARKAAAATTPAQHQRRHRPIVGGVQISPAGANFVGTMGCLVRRRGGKLFALSNNHVLADTNQLPLGTSIVQAFGPGPQDVFAKLTAFEPIRFPSISTPTPRNRIDAAIAAVSDNSLVAAGRMFGIPRYTPLLAAPRPAMQVIKSGRTTAVTRSIISAIRVNGVMVDYGEPHNPMIATFDGCVVVAGGAFSAGGDSGSVILDAASGRPVALLFAGDPTRTIACDLTAVCNRFNVVPA